MPTSTPSVRRPVAFPGGTHDPSANELMVGGAVHRLEPRHSEVLACLLDQAGMVVDKAALLNHVWGDRHVTDDVLVTAIYQLRRNLGDRARAPQFIETIARRGYRWIALPVQDVPAAARVDGLGAETPPSTDEPGAVSPPTPEPISTTTPSSPRRDIDPDRGSRQRWKAAVAATLMLTALALGAHSLRPSLVLAEHGPDTAAPQVALDEVRELLTRRTPASLTRARTILGWRLETHPDDAEALALDARAAVFRAELTPTDRPRLVREARRAADRAQALRPDAVDTLLADGLVALLHERDPGSARRALVEAHRRAPENPEALQAVSWWLSIDGRHRAALAAARAAVAHDPNAATRWMDYAFLARNAGDPKQATEAARIALDLAPGSFFAAALELWSRRDLGEVQPAVDDFLQHLGRFGVSEAVQAQLRSAHDDDGFEGFHRQWVGLWGPRLPPLDHAVAALMNDDPSAALDHLAAAVERGDPETLWLDSLPELEALRSHPRFARLRIASGLGPAPKAGGSTTLLGRLHPVHGTLIPTSVH